MLFFKGPYYICHSFSFVLVNYVPQQMKQMISYLQKLKK